VVFVFSLMSYGFSDVQLLLAVTSRTGRAINALQDVGRRMGAEKP
jgi:hypothetical protein